MDKFEIAELQTFFYDIYKDAYGFRPRHINISKMSKDTLISEINYLQSIVEENEIEDAKREKIAIENFNALIEKTILIGAKNRETAIRWLAESSDCSNDLEFLCYQHGLPYQHLS